ncbi:N2,N2-dimethylguanosine tRNA methyltransferase [Methanocaldococcus infernus ME]|uniref:tRNA (guanine(26)-N(2))-dimethyltransferase n=1 Tax=Methanocaldococcus infernus (strain DSM 11812 / JCM 15783 / ME) TaxID=573063 RepID=D5VTX6_METIM|nr:tRNA (guanine(10)-N(2))-dimethyltransferase [Methanocaldococcus infernus]ADG14029.1 N2,N2-dimethylguanosine tRNA methyltransferase [Methanocaldococcus infernus ME]
MIIEEGKVKIDIPDDLTITKDDEVFYNPKMETCRDISVAVIKAFLEGKEEFYIADALAGTGVRGLRYAKEVGGEVYLNDINPKAYKRIIANANLNNIKNIKVFNEDANVFLAKHFRFFHVVDIDPFGSPSPYIDMAIRALKPKNALLCLTATDTAALCGRAKKACLRKYLAYPLLSRDCHEMALRILIGYAMRMATKYEIQLMPIFAHATDHYVRVYLKTDRGAKKADEVFKYLGYVREVNGFKIIKPYNKPEENFAGPLYIGNLYNKEIVEKALKYCEGRAYKIVSKIKEEAEIEQVGCYDTHQLGKLLKVSVPPINYIVESLKEKGYKVAIPHYNPRGIKTNAPPREIIDIMVRK